MATGNQPTVQWGPDRPPKGGAPENWNQLGYAPLDGPCDPAVQGPVNPARVAQLIKGGFLDPAHATRPGWFPGNYSWLWPEHQQQWDWTQVVRRMLADQLTALGTPEAGQRIAAKLPAAALVMMLTEPVRVTTGDQPGDPAVVVSIRIGEERNGPAGSAPSEHWRQIFVTVRGGGRSATEEARLLLLPQGRIRRPDVPTLTGPVGLALPRPPASVELSPAAVERLRQAGVGIDPAAISAGLVGQLPAAVDGGWRPLGAPRPILARVDGVELLVTVATDDQWQWVYRLSLSVGPDLPPPGTARPDLQLTVPLSPEAAVEAGYPQPAGGVPPRIPPKPVTYGPVPTDLTESASPDGTVRATDAPVPRAVPLRQRPPEPRLPGPMSGPQVAALLLEHLDPALAGVPIGDNGLYVGAAGGPRPGLAGAGAARPVRDRFTIHLGGDVTLRSLGLRQLLLDLPPDVPVSIHVGDNGDPAAAQTVQRWANHFSAEAGRPLVLHVPWDRFSSKPLANPYAVPMAPDRSATPGPWAASFDVYPETGVLVRDRAGTVRFDQDAPASPPLPRALYDLPLVAGETRKWQLPEGWILDAASHPRVVTARPPGVGSYPIGDHGDRQAFELGVPGLTIPPSVAAVAELIWGPSRGAVDWVTLGRAVTVGGTGAPGERATPGEHAAYDELVAAIPPGSGFQLRWGSTPGTFVLHRGDPGDLAPAPPPARGTALALAPDTLTADGAADVAVLLGALPDQLRADLSVLLPPRPAAELPALADLFAPPRPGPRPLIVAPADGPPPAGAVPVSYGPGGWVVTFPALARFVELRPGDQPAGPVAPHGLTARPDGRFGLPGTDWVLDPSAPDVLDVVDPAAAPLPAGGTGVRTGAAPPAPVLAALGRLLREAGAGPDLPISLPGVADPWPVLDEAAYGSAPKGHEARPVPGGTLLHPEGVEPLSLDPAAALGGHPGGPTLFVDGAVHSLAALVAYLEKQPAGTAVHLQPPPRREKLEPDQVRQTAAHLREALGRPVPVLVSAAALAGPAGPGAVPVDHAGRPTPAVWATRWKYEAGVEAPPAVPPGTSVLDEVVARWDAHHQAGGDPKLFPTIDADTAERLLTEVAALTVDRQLLDAHALLAVRDSLAPPQRVRWVLRIGELIVAHPDVATVFGGIQRNIVWCGEVAPNHLPAA